MSAPSAFGLVDARGYDLSKPRGKKPKLTDDQLRSAHLLHTIGEISIRELGRRGWRVWGYSSEDSARCALRDGFARLGLPRRERMEAAIMASTINGLSSGGIRDPSHPDHDRHLEHRRHLKRQSGAVRGVTCISRKSRGGPCRRAALPDSFCCFSHDPRYREEVEAYITAAREHLGLEEDPSLESQEPDREQRP